MDMDLAIFFHTCIRCLKLCHIILAALSADNISLLEMLQALSSFSNVLSSMQSHNHTIILKQRF